jgi:hypothetical protein
LIIDLIIINNYLYINIIKAFTLNISSLINPSLSTECGGAVEQAFRVLEWSLTKCHADLIPSISCHAHPKYLLYAKRDYLLINGPEFSPSARASRTSSKKQFLPKKTTVLTKLPPMAVLCRCVGARFPRRLPLIPMEDWLGTRCRCLDPPPSSMLEQLRAVVYALLPFPPTCVSKDGIGGLPSIALVFTSGWGKDDVISLRFCLSSPHFGFLYLSC